MGPVLGRGGMGQVRQAWDRRLDRGVAVKVLRPEFATDPATRRRFEAEARSAARLVHPNIVAIFDTGEDGGVPYIVMERLPGTTLKDLVANGPMATDAVRDLGKQVLAALDAAHRAGIVHRDIKPSNILSAEDGTWKVGDFGIAKSIEAGDPDQTRTGLVLGTPAYLAPERLYGQAATAATDVFSLGVVLYEALAGVRPFEPASGAASPWSLPPPVPVATVRRGVDPRLASVIDRSIAVDPPARFQSAREMSDALMGSGAVAPGLDETRVMTGRAPGPSDTEVLVAPALLAGWRRRWPATTKRIVAGAAVVGVVLLVALSIPGNGSKSPTTSTTVAQVVAPSTPPTTTPPTTPPTTPARPAHHKHGGPGPGGPGPGPGGDGQD